MASPPHHSVWSFVISESSLSSYSPNIVWMEGANCRSDPHSGPAACRAPPSTPTPCPRLLVRAQVDSFLWFAPVGQRVDDELLPAPMARESVDGPKAPIAIRVRWTTGPGGPHLSGDVCPKEAANNLQRMMLNGK